MHWKGGQFTEFNRMVSAGLIENGKFEQMLQQSKEVRQVDTGRTIFLAKE
jgi:hypothetical protein